MDVQIDGAIREDRPQFEPTSEPVDVAAEGRHPWIRLVLKVGDRTLGDSHSFGELNLCEFELMTELRECLAGPAVHSRQLRRVRLGPLLYAWAWTWTTLSARLGHRV